MHLASSFRMRVLGGTTCAVLLWSDGRPAVGEEADRSKIAPHLEARRYHTGPTAGAVRSAIDRYRLGNEVIRSRHYPTYDRTGRSVAAFSQATVRPPLFSRPQTAGRQDVSFGSYLSTRWSTWGYPPGRFLSPYPACPPAPVWYPVVWPWYGGYWYGSGAPYFQRPWIDDEYRYFRYGRAMEQTHERTKRLLDSHHQMMLEGVAAFRDGRYEQALSAFKLAAGMNVFDPTSRVHAAHACFALHRYGEAVRWLREAFRLEPRLCELPYDLRSDYGRGEDFEEHLASLKSAVELVPTERDPLILLGYVYLYTGRRAEAHQALTQAAERLGTSAPRDELVSMLQKASEPNRSVAGRKDG